MAVFVRRATMASAACGSSASDTLANALTTLLRSGDRTPRANWPGTWASTSWTRQRRWSNAAMTLASPRSDTSPRASTASSTTLAASSPSLNNATRDSRARMSPCDANAAMPCTALLLAHQGVPSNCSSTAPKSSKAALPGPSPKWSERSQRSRSPRKRTPSRLCPARRLWCTVDSPNKLIAIDLWTSNGMQHSTSARCPLACRACSAGSSELE
mmetsp:Transcript_14807/g.30105  ORF Transcript_14807/g.30105 Transcript_14807/m.30105 type:complete len:214 (+) Transcript_14807:66-707(+)